MKRFLLLPVCLFVVGFARSELPGKVGIQNLSEGRTVIIRNNAVPADSIPPDSTGMSSRPALELTPEMVPGWNVGNSLDATGGETSWGNPLISQKLIDSVKDAGFRSVRIPVAWSKFTDTSTYAIDTNFMNRVEQVVNYVLKDSMYAVMNLHWDGGWMQPTYAKEAYVNNRLSVMWHQIAVHFRDYGDHLIFAGMNEVMVEGDYGTPSVEYYTVQNGFNQTFVNAVRSTGGRNAYRYLAVQGFNTNIDFTVDYFVVPTDAADHRLFVEVHYYDPYDYTLNTGSSITQWGMYAITPTQTETWANESYADGQFNKMKTKYVDNGIGVIIGEYGAMARLSSDDSINNLNALYREYYMLYITKSIEKHGLIPFYWDNGYTSNYNMGIFDRSSGARAYPELIQAIVDTSFTVEFPEVPQQSSIKSNKNEEIKIYPNPGHSLLSVELNGDSPEFCRIYDNKGQLITDMPIHIGTNVFNISNLSTGLYFIQISLSKRIVVQKLIID